MSKKEKTKDINLSKNLASLSAIAAWFDNQDEVDVEEGLKKVKEAATLIKESNSRLAEIENEFEEIKKDIEAGAEEDVDEEEESEAAEVGQLPF
ncbi:MAG: exodeoxyribonuclease VII small subunit [Candidatus Magasanikbacteria bacterium]|nr:exodeoxyribonuclease VII small subunit [Candidatus Magasanikbacteria bacterium]